jgi:hypothetical protein
MNGMKNVDAALLRWAESFNERHTARVTARSMTGLPIKRSSRKKAVTANDVRRQLRGIVQKRPQVMVRISGGGRGMLPIRAHLNYISRNGQLPMEDQEGERYQGQGDVQDLSADWQVGGFPIEDTSSRREAYNVVLSMPAGTDAIALHRAARAFAKDEFDGHQYAMVLHTFESDPNYDPSENPHVHLCVKALGADGTRLNPRKDDLRRWREQFAERLRENGVEAEASSRRERFQPTPGKRQAVYHQSPEKAAKTDLAATSRKKALGFTLSAKERKMLKGYSELARALAGSTTESDRELAIAIVRNMERIDDPILHRDVIAGRPIER